MEVIPQQSVPAEPLHVLAAAKADGRRLEIVRRADGTFAIAIDGRPEDGYRWTAGGVEQCVKTYMTLLRHRPPLH